MTVNFFFRLFPFASFPQTSEYCDVGNIIDVSGLSPIVRTVVTMGDWRETSIIFQLSVDKLPFFFIMQLHDVHSFLGEISNDCGHHDALHRSSFGFKYM